MAMLRRAGKVATQVAPTALVASVGLHVLGALAILATGVACWVIRSDNRTARVSRCCSPAEATQAA
jgi:hypothetical protein